MVIFGCHKSKPNLSQLPAKLWFDHQSSLVTELHTELRSLRQAYLSTAAPRKTHLHASARNGASRPIHLTDRDKEEIDARAKMTLRDLNARIRALEDAEELRQNTEQALIQKKYSRGLGALGSWAAGGGGLGIKKSDEQIAAEAAARQVSAHREGVMWFLRERLRETIGTQQQMMETRLRREVEKNRSVLAKARGPFTSVAPLRENTHERNAAVEEEEESKRSAAVQDLTQDQLQMFEKGNQDMLKHFANTLDKVRLVWVIAAQGSTSTGKLTIIPGRQSNRWSRLPNSKMFLLGISQPNQRTSISW